jgi:hypothetical protein
VRRVVTGEYEQGRSTVVLPEAETVRLRVGDCAVQRGTWHSWENRDQEPCVIAGLMIATAG